MSAYLAKLLDGVGVPVARNTFKQPQPPPFIVYLFTYSHNFGADSGVYIARNNYQIELYTAKKDIALEHKLEGILTAENIYFEKTETYIESENLLEVMYEIQLLGGNND